MKKVVIAMLVFLISMPFLMAGGSSESADDVVTVTYDSENATITEEWSVEQGDEEPKVKMTITAKQNGNYSVVIPAHDSYEESEYAYGLAPMQYRGHGFPEDALLITEQYMFTPMVSVSLPENNAVVPGKQVTYGYTVEPSWIPLRILFLKILRRYSSASLF